MTRYYMQLDSLYLKMYQRAVEQGKKKVGFGWERCAEFVKRCVDDGVPVECLDHIENVKATRVIGQGSEFMRQQSLEFLFGTVFPMLPESGRFNLIQDVVASRAGQSAVVRYAPDQENKLPDNQYLEAVNQVANMKVGVPAVSTESQNPAVFAGVYVDAATQSIQSLEQGGNPAEVVAFLELCGQALAQQIQRMSGDPSRADLVKLLSKKLQEIGNITDKLIQQLNEEAQMQQQNQEEMLAAQQSQMSDQALKKQMQDFKMQMQAEKSRQQMQTKGAQASQAMAIRDAETAQSITLTQAEAEAKMAAERIKAAQKPKSGE